VSFYQIRDNRSEIISPTDQLTLLSMSQGHHFTYSSEKCPA